MRLFVYGTLKRGFHNHHILGEDAAFVSRAWLERHDMYSVYGQFPAVVPGHGVVYGEVYDVSDNQLGMLDRLEGVPHMYDRYKVTVLMPIAAEERTTEAGVYLWRQPYDKFEHIANGEWK